MQSDIRGFILLIAVVVLLIMSGAVVSAENNWTEENTKLELAYQAVNIIDWRQTIYIANNPDKFSETNPLFSTKHPSVEEVNWHFTSNAIFHPLISLALAPQYRKYWQYITVTVTGAFVLNNARIGVQLQFKSAIGNLCVIAQCCHIMT
jgi:hypothetical protein